MNVSENVRKIREKKCISQAELAREVGVTASMINQIERGTKNPSLQLGVEIARVLDCSVMDLVQ